MSAGNHRMRLLNEILDAVYTDYPFYAGEET